MNETKPHVVYICDGKACKECNPDFCAHTQDVTHAVNFTRIDGPGYSVYVEDKEDD